LSSTKSKLIFLDEPTLGLDVESKTYLRSKIIELSQQGHALLVSSHELGFIEDISTRVLFMGDGMIREVTEQIFALGLEQAPMVITLMTPLMPEMSETLQKISADIKLEESSIEVPDYVFKKVIDCLDTKTIQFVVRKTPSLESLFLTTPSNKVTNLEKEVIL
jgi:ABC-type multidrug transport system ATPase subunit